MYRVKWYVLLCKYVYSILYAGPYIIPGIGTRERGRSIRRECGGSST